MELTIKFEIEKHIDTLLYPYRNKYPTLSNIIDPYLVEIKCRYSFSYKNVKTLSDIQDIDLKIKKEIEHDFYNIEILLNNTRKTSIDIHKIINTPPAKYQLQSGEKPFLYNNFTSLENRN